MRKVVLLVLVFGGLLFGGQTILFEAFQDGTLNIPVGYADTTVLKLEFSLDTGCHVLIGVGGIEKNSTMWLLMDGDTVQNSLRPETFGAPLTFDQTYMQLITKGQHSISLRWKNISAANFCQYARLQALIFLPDSASAVAEQPAVEPGRPVTNAVISRGPYVSAPGASMVVDATGRVMENVLVDSKVQISTLPAGTYYAKDEERTVVKIVKVD